MSAIPEPRQNVNPESSVSNGDGTFSLFPDILRGAAYVSTGGRVYNLFSEEDEATILKSPLGAPLRMDPMAFTEDPEEETTPDFTESVEIKTEPVVDKPEQTESIETNLETLQTEETEDIDVFVSEFDQWKNTVRPSVEEVLRRKRGVEGICGSKAKPRRMWVDTPGPKPTNSEESAESAKPRKMPLRSEESERPTLKLFDVLPKPSVTPRSASDKIPNRPKTTLFSATENGKRPVDFEATIKLLETAAPKKTLHKTKKPERTETTGTVSDSPPKRNIVRLNVPRTRRLSRPFAPRQRATETTVPPPEIVESASIPTHEVPAQEIESEKVVGDVLNNIVKTHLSASSRWRLHWHPVWPEHLDSLERDASNQIRHLADHLESQIRQDRKVISFNGYRPGDGCTTYSLCAAREMAERGYRLLLADAHRQHPELALLLELDIDPHLYEIMTLIPDRLELLPWSESFIEIDSHEESHTISFTDIVASLRNEYDLILLDGGSLIESPLGERVAQWRRMRSDGVLLVVNTKNPEPVNVQAVARRLERFNIELLGVTENYA